MCGPDEWSVLHVINCLTHGGASRALAALANVQAGDANASIAVLSLTPAEDGASALLEGVALLDRVRWSDVFHHVARSDIVHAHVWNTPELIEFLRRPLPAMRLVLWLHVANRAAPQRIPRAVFGQAEAVAVSASATLTHPPFVGLETLPEVIVAARDLTSFLALQRTSCTKEITCGHVGSLDPIRLPDGLLQAYARPALRNLTFEFAGGGPLLDQFRKSADELALAGRTRFHGPVGDVAGVLRDWTIFCSPQGRFSYASSDMAIEEAMAAGLPCVLLSPEGCSDLVEDGVTGLVVDTMENYIGALAALAEDDASRDRLGRQARETARTRFRPEATALSFRKMYERLLDRPKARRDDLRARRTGGIASIEAAGAEAFLFAMDGDCPEFEASLDASTEREAHQADAQIARLDQRLWGATLGGVRHYASRYPSDAWLAYWSGLGYLGAGAPVRALLEFKKALDQGMPRSRFEQFERQAASAAASPPASNAGQMATST